ncbi:MULTISPECIES: hypothetical protein [Streptomyces]|uniref:hypothetical protein n=1 Tax=Streptomyces TaxID=1883 RepID=UPI0023B9BBC6|nr:MULTISPECIES: hypothetical protein [unclassified Streptomyces]MDT0424470.1 hypothetical protein [Streptomyces sp. DSM 41859]WEH28462.1 hypothetical protein P0D76_14575 [Streptomyces sp. AM 3-1-1]
MTDGMTESAVRDGEEPRRERDTPGGEAGLPEPRAEEAPVPPPDRERRRRRAEFLRDLKEARELRERVQPRRARAARMRRQQLRMRSFRW